MLKFQKQLDDLQKYLKTQGDFNINTESDNYFPPDTLFYKISHPNFKNTYMNKFETNNDSPNPPFRLDEFINSTKEKHKAFEEYFKYFNSSDKYNFQFLNSYDNQLDIIITHIDTNRKYVLIQDYDIMEQNTPLYHLYREIVFSPIDGKCKFVNLTNLPIMHIELTKFNRKPNPIDLTNTISNELKFDTQNYVSYK